MRCASFARRRTAIAIGRCLAILAAACAAPVAAQDLVNARLGLGHELFMTFKPEQLVGPNGAKLEIDYINKGVVNANVVNKTRLRLVAQKRGKCGVRITPVGGSTKTYLFDVVDPRQIDNKDSGRQPLEMGVGHDRMIPLPDDFAEGPGEPVITVGNPDALSFDIVNKYIRLIAKEEGDSDLTLISAANELTGYRVTVHSSREAIAGEAGKNPLQLAVGHSRMLKLPGSLAPPGGKLTPLAATAIPRVATVNVVSPEMIYVIAQNEGVSDLTFMTSEGKLYLYRVTVLPPGARVDDEPKKEVLRLMAGQNHELLLPLDFVEGKRQTMIAAADPAVLGFKVISTKKLLLEPKAPGTSDLTLMDAKGRLHLYRALVAPDPKQDPQGGDMLLAVGQEEFLLFPRGLVRAQTLAKIKVANPLVADVRMLSPRRIRVVGMMKGKTKATIELVDGRTIEYQVTVARVRDLPTPQRRKLDLALGTSRVIDLPANFTEGELRTTITVGNPQVALFSVFNERYLYVVAKSDGETDLSLLSASDELYQYRVRVLPADTKVEDEPAKTLIEMTAGSNREIDLPADFTKGRVQSTIATANPKVLGYTVLKGAQKLRLDAKAAGTSDLTLLSASGELTRYRVKVTPK